MIKNKFTSIFLCLALLLAYTAPVCFAKTSKNAVSVEQECISSINLDWWHKFNDPVLIDYISKAIYSNHDLKSTFLKVSASRAKVREVFGRELPQVRILLNFIRINTPFTNNSGNKKYENFFTLPLFANYELDLWQKNRKRTLAEEEKLEAERQNARIVYIMLTTEVASAYFNILKLDKLIEIQNKLVKLEAQNLKILEAKYCAGLTARDELFTAQRSLTEANKTLTEFDKQREAFINQLLVLTGNSPEAKEQVARNSLDKICFPEDIPFEIPSEVIMARPDILKQEAWLKNAKINISLARRDFLPDLNIYGLFAFNSNSFKRVFNWDDYIVAVGASFIGKLFTGGQRRARLKQRKFEYEQMLQDYQQAILVSLQEVNDSLYSLKNNLKINRDDKNRIKFECSNLGLVNVKYEKGLVAYKDTINPQKSVILLQQDEVQSKTAYLVDTLNLYKALGGKIW